MSPDREARPFTGLRCGPLGRGLPPCGDSTVLIIEPSLGPAQGPLTVRRWAPSAAATSPCCSRESTVCTLSLAGWDRLLSQLLLAQPRGVGRWLATIARAGDGEVAIARTSFSKGKK